MGNSPKGTAATDIGARVSTFYSRETWIEGRAEDQLTEVAAWPGMREVAAFPDLHPGRHGPVGAAFLADRLYPQLVGPDIGCGMALFALDLPRRKLRIDKAARRLRVLEEGLSPEAAEVALRDAGLPAETCGAGLGTIGGGNHFCEVQAIEEIFDPEIASRLGLSQGQLCLLVHSGSRSQGAGIFAGIEASWRNGFATGSAEAEAYLHLHDGAVAWAALNRRLVADAAAAALRVDLTPLCDSVHNHVLPYEDGWLHRKGAAAPDGGLAPLAGSRESLSYLLCAGSGPDAALGSLSHGAGRRYDRASMHGRIRKTRSGLAAMEKTRFGGQVICDDPDLLIEEAGHAYKDAGRVVADLEAFGITRRVLALTPLITFKTAKNGDLR